jgi:hypothetical protein
MRMGSGAKGTVTDLHKQAIKDKLVSIFRLD